MQCHMYLLKESQFMRREKSFPGKTQVTWPCTCIPGYALVHTVALLWRQINGGELCALGEVRLMHAR